MQMATNEITCAHAKAEQRRWTSSLSGNAAVHLLDTQKARLSNIGWSQTNDGTVNHTHAWSGRTPALDNVVACDCCKA